MLAIGDYIMTPIYFFTPSLEQSFFGYLWHKGLLNIAELFIKVNSPSISHSVKCPVLDLLASLTFYHNSKSKVQAGGVARIVESLPSELKL
jgi:hypothetical protein